MTPSWWGAAGALALGTGLTVCQCHLYTCRVQWMPYCLSMPPVHLQGAVDALLLSMPPVHLQGAVDAFKDFSVAQAGGEDAAKQEGQAAAPQAAPETMQQPPPHPHPTPQMSPIPEPGPSTVPPSPQGVVGWSAWGPAACC
jgi:hypothetical protein